jgi:hypothetical protein
VPITTALATQPTLRTERLTLVQLGPEHHAAAFAALADADATRLTGTRATFTPEQVMAHLERLPGADDRGDADEHRRMSI